MCRSGSICALFRQWYKQRAYSRVRKKKSSNELISLFETFIAIFIYIHSDIKQHPTKCGFY